MRNIMSKKIIFCKKCLYPSNHPLLLTFLENGVCMGCIIHEEKNNIDWNKKFLELKKLVEGYKTDTYYDCIVPVCGGRDSFFIVYIVKHVLKLNPLLVSYNRLYNTAIGIKNLENLRTYFQCDIVTHTPHIESIKVIIRATLDLLGSMHWPYLAGSTVFPVQMAVRHKVPLIIWGAHQGIDQVGMFSHHDEVEMTRRYRREHDLMGCEAEDLVDKHPNLTEKILQPFFYPSDKELEKTGVRGIYLNNYIRWDSKAQHEDMIRDFGYLTRKAESTFDNYNDVHCFHYLGTHDYIKNSKFGFGKVVDQACREIRLGRLTRQEALRVVSNYRNAGKPKDLEKFLAWINLTEKEFQNYIDKHRDLNIWEKVNGIWEVKKTIVDHDMQSLQASQNLHYIVNTSNTHENILLRQDSSDYPLLTQGWSPEYTKPQSQKSGMGWFPERYKEQCMV